MAERKQRITRKYLRERSNIAQSELEVPFIDPAEEDLTNSEQYKESQVNLQRSETGSPMPRPPPPPMRRRPTAAERNWLLAADPSADPYATTEEEASKKKTADWSAWGQEREQSPYGGTQRESLFGRRTQEDPAVNSSRYGARQDESANAGGYQPLSFGKQPRQQEKVPGQGYPSLFGRQQEGNSGTGLNVLNPAGARIYNPALNQGGLQSPYQRGSTTSSAERSQVPGSQKKSYTPYKSPYETQRMKQQQKWGQQQQQGQEYKRVDPYQEWKKRNPVLHDPTGDDAFINEVMPNSRR